MRFTVTVGIVMMTATCDDPRLRGVEWWWHPGSSLVHYGLSGVAVGVGNLWDHTAKRISIEPTAEAFERWLTERYADPFEVDVVVDEIRLG